MFTLWEEDKAISTIREKLKQYKKSKYWSPAYNSVYGLHNGSFYKALCEAIYRADRDNIEILQNAYPELFEIMWYLDNNFTRIEVNKVLKEIEEENAKSNTNK